MSPRLKLKDLSDAKVREICEQTNANILQLDDGIKHRLREIEQSLAFVVSALSSGDDIQAPAGIIASIESIAQQATKEYKAFRQRQRELF